MMIPEMLDELLDLAKKDKTVRERLVATAGSDNPVAEFCSIATELGFPMTEIKRSTNGGGENSPDLDYQNDEYSIFMMRLKDIK